MTASVVLLFDLSFRRIKLFAFCYVFYLSCVCEGDFLILEKT
jgi:hypothetical protein